MTDRRLGYIILGFLTLFIGVVICVFVWIIVPQKHVLIFDQVGNLKIDDPVLVRGCLVGSVVSIEWKRPNVFVTIQSNQPLTLYPGYMISNLDKGFMGERTLQIDPGDTLQQALADIDTLRGTFYPGISEALSATPILKKYVRLFGEIAHDLRYGTTEKQSLIIQINRLMADLDSVSTSILATTTSVNKTIGTQIDILNNALDTVDRYSNEIDQALTPGLATVAAELNKLDAGFGKVETMLDSLKVLTAFVQANDTAQWNTTLRSLKTNVSLLREGIDFIRTNGLTLKANLAW